MHAIMKFRMRRRDRYECDVPHPLSLDGTTCFALVKINKAEFTKRRPLWSAKFFYVPI